MKRTQSVFMVFATWLAVPGMAQSVPSEQQSQATKAAQSGYEAELRGDTLAAATYYQAACTGGNAIGCTNSARLYHLSDNFEQAIMQYRIALKIDPNFAVAKQGLTAAGNAATNAGLAAEQSINYVEALRLYRIGCDANISIGCSNLGLSFHGARGTRQDLEKAAEAYERALKLDPTNAVATKHLSMVQPIVAQSRKRKADAAAMAKAGYDAEILGKKSEAASQYRASCTNENSIGCANLARLYEKGAGVALDTEQARIFYERAVWLDPANSEAKVNLERVKAELAEWQRTHAAANAAARAAAKRAAKVQAEENLALGYFAYTQNDIWIAVGEFSKACENDISLGCANLGVLYQNEKIGSYSSGSEYLAKKYFSKACSLGHAASCKPPVKLEPVSVTNAIIVKANSAPEIPIFFRGRFAVDCKKKFDLIIGNHSIFQQNRLAGRNRSFVIKGNFLTSAASFDDEIAGGSFVIPTYYEYSKDGKTVLIQEKGSNDVLLKKCR